MPQTDRPVMTAGSIETRTRLAWRSRNCVTPRATSAAARPQTQVGVPRSTVPSICGCSMRMGMCMVVSFGGSCGSEDAELRPQDVADEALGKQGEQAGGQARADVQALHDLAMRGDVAP